jgi:hypothetical protein
MDKMKGHNAALFLFTLVTDLRSAPQTSSALAAAAGDLMN